MTTAPWPMTDSGASAPIIITGGINYICSPQSTKWVWKGWNNEFVTTSANTVTVTTVWPSWNQQFAGSNATSVLTATATGGYVWHPEIGYSPYHRETEEKARARASAYEAERRRQEEQLAEHNRRIIKVNDVARKLLLEHLSDEQRKQFEKDKYFELVGGSSKRVYRIDATGQAVRVNEQRRPVESYCIHPPLDHALPLPDLILAKKLMLELDESTFLKTANATRLTA